MTDYSTMSWEVQPPFLFGRYRIYGSFDPAGDDVYAALTVKPAGAGSRVEWEASPIGYEGTLKSGSVSIDDSRDQDAAILAAKEASVAVLNAYKPPARPKVAPRPLVGVLGRAQVLGGAHEALEAPPITHVELAHHFLEELAQEGAPSIGQVMLVYLEAREDARRLLGRDDP